MGCCWIALVMEERKVGWPLEMVGSVEEGEEGARPLSQVGVEGSLLYKIHAIGIYMIGRSPNNYDIIGSIDIIDQTRCYWNCGMNYEK